MKAVAEILATAGYDWITVDLEHTPISLSQAEKLVRVIDLAGAKPYVRVSSNNAAEIKKSFRFWCKRHNCSHGKFSSRSFHSS